MWIGPTVKIGGLLIQDDPRWIDQLTYDVAYKRGYREPRFSVPAHHYHTLIRDISVEMTTGIVKSWPADDPFNDSPYIDCYTVLYIVSEELINAVSTD